MERKETLRQYLTYNKDMDEINDIFGDLSAQLKYLHGNGYYVSELNSDSIILETSKYSSENNKNLFLFASLTKMKDKKKEKADNIIALSKLAIGSFISVENGFCDYSQLDTAYIKQYFDDMEMYLPNNKYFRGVIMDEDTSMYYSDYVNSLNNRSKGNTVQKTKTTSQGKIYAYDNNEDAAYVRVVFYPVMIIAVITITVILYTFFK